MDKKQDLRIRKAELQDMEGILEIYAAARRYMAEKGNPGQWLDGYPKRELLEEDMKEGALYVCTGCGADKEELLGVFAFFVGIEDPSYGYIEAGRWLNDEPYGVVHRIAVSESAHGRGVGRFCLDECGKLVKNLRIDTHRDNLPMQKVIEQCGFKYCGIIYVEDGSPRLAFMKTMERD